MLRQCVEVSSLVQLFPFSTEENKQLSSTISFIMSRSPLHLGATERLKDCNQLPSVNKLIIIIIKKKKIQRDLFTITKLHRRDGEVGNQ